MKKVVLSKCLNMTANCEQSRVARQVTFGSIIYLKKLFSWSLLVTGQYYLTNKNSFHTGLTPQSQL
jgi:hypothetical protein